MTAEIAVAAISGLASIFAVIITTKSGNKEITHKIETNQAITDTKLQNLTDEVRTYTGFAQRVPIIDEQIKSINHRLDDLERSERNGK